MSHYEDAIPQPHMSYIPTTVEVDTPHDRFYIYHGYKGRESDQVRLDSPTKVYVSSQLEHVSTSFAVTMTVRDFHKEFYKWVGQMRDKYHEQP